MPLSDAECHCGRGSSGLCSDAECRDSLRNDLDETRRPHRVDRHAAATRDAAAHATYDHSQPTHVRLRHDLRRYSARYCETHST